VIPVGADYFVAGAVTRLLAFEGHPVTGEMFIARLDPSFGVRWLKALDSPGSESITSVTRDSRSHLLISGYTTGPLDLGDSTIDPRGTTVRFVAKYEGTKGDLVWKKVLYGVDSSSFKDGLFVDADDDVVLCGASLAAVEVDTTFLQYAGGRDVYVIKLSPQGDVRLARSYGGSGFEHCQTVAVDRQGAILIGGHFDATSPFELERTLSSRGGDDVFLAKLTPDGDPSWSVQLGGAKLDWIERIAVDQHDNLISTGGFTGAIEAGTAHYSSQGAADAFVAKWSGDDGELLWLERIAGSGSSVAVGPSDEVVVAGAFSGTVDFGEGPRTSAGAVDGFVQKYDGAGGAFVWALQLGGRFTDSVTRVDVDDRGRTFINAPFTAFVEDPINFGQGWLTESGIHYRWLAP
jgi:hypothetical protein